MDPMTEDHREFRRTLRVLEHPDHRDRVSTTCRHFGVGRASFNGWRGAYRRKRGLVWPAADLPRTITRTRRRRPSQRRFRICGASIASGQCASPGPEARSRDHDLRRRRQPAFSVATASTTCRVEVARGPARSEACDPRGRLAMKASDCCAIPTLSQAQMLHKGKIGLPDIGHSPGNLPKMVRFCNFL